MDPQINKVTPTKDKHANEICYSYFYAKQMQKCRISTKAVLTIWFKNLRISKTTLIFVPMPAQKEQCSYGVKASCGESPPPSRLGGLRRRLGGLKRLGGPKQGSALSPRRRHNIDNGYKTINHFTFLTSFQFSRESNSLVKIINVCQ